MSFLILALVAILFSRTILAILAEEHSCENILKLGHWPRRRYHLKVFLLLAFAAILFSRAIFD